MGVGLPSVGDYGVATPSEREGKMRTLLNNDQVKLESKSACVVGQAWYHLDCNGEMVLSLRGPVSKKCYQMGKINPGWYQEDLFLDEDGKWVWQGEEAWEALFYLVQQGEPHSSPQDSEIPAWLVEKLDGMAKGEYQKRLMWGRARWSGGDLKGKARLWAGKYLYSRLQLFGRLKLKAAQYGWRADVVLFPRKEFSKWKKEVVGDKYFVTPTPSRYAERRLVLTSPVGITFDYIMDCRIEEPYISSLKRYW